MSFDRILWSAMAAFGVSMALVLSALATHHLRGNPLLAVGTVGGIVSVNVVYARCSVLTKAWRSWG